MISYVCTELTASNSGSRNGSGALAHWKSEAKSSDRSRNYNFILAQISCLALGAYTCGLELMDVRIIARRSPSVGFLNDFLNEFVQLNIHDSLFIHFKLFMDNLI